MQKNERQNTILNIIGATRIGRQDELVKLLRKNGFSVTQASVSRDLDDLSIVKVNGFYAQPEKQAGAFGLGLFSLEAAGPFMVVAKCPSGLASASAVRIDAAKLEEIVGTIAGDDTIFIAVKDEKAQKAVIKQLWELFGG
jgi:transcriptional regulator of arginine metabolism